jgi:hypothetical protein
MRITAILDKDGKIVGTMPYSAGSTSEHPVGRFVPGPEQTVREVELPDEVGKSRSAADLHGAVEEVLNREGGQR